MTTSDKPASVDITPNQDGGVLKQILREGQGDEVPFTGDKVYVHYVGTLLDGTKFDSSRDRNEKFTFDVGRGSVIKGWDLGIPTMKRGELATFTIRSDYGYGAAGSPPTIAPDATLVFEIELFDFHGEDLSANKDLSLVRRVLKAGSGYTSPNDGSRVVVNLKGMDNNGRVFDGRQNLEFEIGEVNAELYICEGLEQSLLKFKKGEHSRLHIKANLAWGLTGCQHFNVEPNTDVIYEVELTSFEKCKESWQLNGGEKLEQGELLKNRGTEHFKVCIHDCFIYIKLI
jgi:FK506-binding protein 4/5